VDDEIDVTEGARDRVRVPDVTTHELDVLGEVRRPFRGSVDLVDEAVEGTDGVAVRQQFVREMRADEARTARDEYPLLHVVATAGFQLECRETPVLSTLDP
jgi:hypothetical protein